VRKCSSLYGFWLKKLPKFRGPGIRLSSFYIAYGPSWISLARSSFSLITTPLWSIGHGVFSSSILLRVPMGLISNMKSSLSCLIVLTYWMDTIEYSSGK